VKFWVGISVGIHLAALGFASAQPAPTRNFAPLGSVYNVSLVSMPASRPGPRAVAAPPAPRVEPAKTKAPDPKAVKPETKKPDAKDRKPQKPKTGEAAAADSARAPGHGAPVTTSALGTSSTQGSVYLDAANFGFSYYLVSLQAKVASHWYPPGSVGAPGEVLRAIVHFQVDEDGTIREATIETSSGFPYFDRCALEAILRSSPLAPLPREFEEDQLGVHFEFSHTVSPR
jgi:TonB family protein